MSDGKEWATLSPEEFTQLQKYIDCESFSFSFCTNRLLLAPERDRGMDRQDLSQLELLI